MQHFYCIALKLKAARKPELRGDTIISEAITDLIVRLGIGDQAVSCYDARLQVMAAIKGEKWSIVVCCF
jgi:hypothetical protein